VLLRFCAAYIGWTPYLAGRALTFGAPRAVTAPGWAPKEPAEDGRRRIRAALGIAEGTIVFGIVGSLRWAPRLEYAYGAELVRAIRTTSRQDVVVLVVGDGTGVAHLEELAGSDLGNRVRLVGHVEQDEVPSYLAAFDVASLPQSCDQVGSFRYATKLPEYLAASLPIVTGQLPMAYDIALDWSWRLPGRAPWSEEYIGALGELMSTITPDDIAAHRPGADASVTEWFVPEAQQQRVKALLTDLLAIRR
jgi:glycosyltransferase involved in cell wall biosynthesis